jgi:DNA-binding NtrC family response regulator
MMEKGQKVALLAIGVNSEARKAKIQGFIEKPFTAESLMASLAHLVEMHEFRNQRKILLENKNANLRI